MEVFYTLSYMSADENWDEWIDRFVTKIGQILKSEYHKCKSERAAKATQKPKKELIHTATVGGNRIYMNTMELPNRPLKVNSIGRMYEDVCSNFLDH